MGIYIRNNRYYYKKMIEGKVYYRALKLRKGQESFLSARLKQVEEEIFAEHFGIPISKKKDIIFSEYLKKYTDQKKILKKNWARDKQTLEVIKEYIGDHQLSKYGKDEIKQLEEKLSSRGLRPSTINRYFEILRHFFNLAIEDGYLEENPVSKYYVPFVEEGERRSLSSDEIKNILESAKLIQASPRTKIQAIIYDLILLALMTGMRLGEIINLKKEYVRPGMLIIPITHTKHRRRMKGNSKRVKIIVLNSIAEEIITRYKKSAKGEMLFDLPEREPHAIIRKTVDKIRKSTGVSDFSFHQLRHTVSTILSTQVSLATAKTLLGHSDIKTTLKYTHPELTEQRRGVAKLEELFLAISS